MQLIKNKKLNHNPSKSLCHIHSSILNIFIITTRPPTSISFERNKPYRRMVVARSALKSFAKIKNYKIPTIIFHSRKFTFKFYLNKTFQFSIERASVMCVCVCVCLCQRFHFLAILYFNTLINSPICAVQPSLLLLYINALPALNSYSSMSTPCLSDRKHYTKNCRIYACKAIMKVIIFMVLRERFRDFY